MFTFSGAFLIPYFTCVLIGGIPLFYIEVALGQFMTKGGIGAWMICPLFQGQGNNLYQWRIQYSPLGGTPN